MTSDFRYTESLKDLREARRQTGEGMWSQALWISTSLIVANGTPLVVLLNAAVDRQICEPGSLAPLSVLFTLGLVLAIGAMAFWYDVGLKIVWTLSERIRNHIRILDCPSDSDGRKAFEEIEAELACKQKRLRGLLPIHLLLLGASLALLLAGVLTSTFLPSVFDAFCVRTAA